MFGRGTSSKESKPTAAPVIQHFSQVAVRGRPRLICKEAEISIQISLIDQHTNRLLIAQEFTPVTFLVFSRSLRLQKVPNPHCGFGRKPLTPVRRKIQLDVKEANMRFKVSGFKSDMLPTDKLSHVARGLQEIARLADFQLIFCPFALWKEVDLTGRLVELSSQAFQLCPFLFSLRGGRKSFKSVVLEFHC